jgi:hypothetical protein
MRRISPGSAGWISVGVVVVVAELLDERTMSEAFEAASRHPVGRPVLFSAWAILTAHLFGLIPDHYDPFNLLGKRVARSKLK